MLGRRTNYGHLIAVATLAVAAWTTTGISVAHAEPTPTNSGVRIHRYAAFNEQAISGTGKHIAASSPAIRQRTRVSVYGKQLTLSLENNERLTASSLDHADMVMLRGALEDIPNSWVRLTQVASGTYGLIWDGSELYAIEPSAEIKDVLANSLPAPTGGTVIFKLSDTTVDLGNYCSSAGDVGAAAGGTGLATYHALTADVAQPSNTAGSAPKLRLEMQVLADTAFRAEFNSDQAALDAIMVRLNNIDGIYSAQMELQVQATGIRLFEQDPAALSISTNAETLLSSLGQVRAGTPGMNSYAATHLFTGRDLDGDTLGIAYIGNICGARYAVSLSEIRNRGAWIDSLVTAHELGHQLGAVHDGTGACAGTAAQSYLMSAFINGSEQLSQCSRDSIFTTMQYAACLVPVGAPDISVGATNNAPALLTPPSTQQGGGGAIDLGWLLLFSTTASWCRRQSRRHTT